MDKPRWVQLGYLPLIVGVYEIATLRDYGLARACSTVHRSCVCRRTYLSIRPLLLALVTFISVVLQTLCRRRSHHPVSLTFCRIRVLQLVASDACPQNFSEALISPFLIMRSKIASFNYCWQRLQLSSGLRGICTLTWRFSYWFVASRAGPQNTLEGLNCSS